MKTKISWYALNVLALVGLLMGPAMVMAMDQMAADPNGMLAGAKGHHAKGSVALTKETIRPSIHMSRPHQSG